MTVVPIKYRKHRHRAVVENEAIRRGRLASDTPGEYVYSDVHDYISFIGAQVRGSGLNMAAVARASDIIKSGSTVSHLAYGWTDKQGKYHQTQQPRFSTMFGISAALGLEVIIRGRKS